MMTMTREMKTTKTINKNWIIIVTLIKILMLVLVIKK